MLIPLKTGEKMLATDLLLSVWGYLHGAKPTEVGENFTGLPYDPAMFRDQMSQPVVFRDLEVYVRMPEDVAMEEGDLTTFTENMGQLIDGELVQFVSADSNFHLRRL